MLEAVWFKMGAAPELMKVIFLAAVVAAQECGTEQCQATQPPATCGSGAVCDEECLLPEIRKDRYPSPTGFGLLCRPDSCDAAIQARYRQDPKVLSSGLGALECPCNWFGSDCQDDWVSVQQVRKEVLGDFEITYLTIGKGAWRKVMKDYRPGSILRVQHLDQNGIPREQPYALAGKNDEGVLEILTGPPPQGLREVVVEVAHAVRQCATGPCGLFVNPVISGFFNGRYSFLMDGLQSVKQVAIVSSGVGLSGVKAAITELLPRDLGIHVFYGIRDVINLPYQNFWQNLVAQKRLTLTLLVSGPLGEKSSSSGAGDLQDAVQKGAALLEAARSKSDVPEPMRPHKSGKIYAQQAIALDFLAGGLAEVGATLEDTAVIICGRNELLIETPRLLQAGCRLDSASCAALIQAGSTIYACRSPRVHQHLKRPVPRGDGTRLSHRDGHVRARAERLANALFSGCKAERRRAKEYMKWLFNQLEGPVYVDGWEDRDDITVVDVPQDCIGYVTGNRRAALGGIEEEWGTLMFFMNKDDGQSKGQSRGRGGSEQLAIFGSQRARRGAELKVMSAVETKSPGTFTRGVREKFSDEKGFATDRMIFRDDELSYALGKEGSTRKKLALAGHVILEYVGHVCFMAGTLKERRRVKQFLDWLLAQRRGSVTVKDVADRDDCTEMHIPDNCKGWVTGLGRRHGRNL
eukprot:s737_g49.t2